MPWLTSDIPNILLFVIMADIYVSTASSVIIMFYDALTVKCDDTVEEMNE